MAHMMRVPTWLAAAPMGAAIRHGEADARKDQCNQRGDKNVGFLVSLLTALPSSAATMAMMRTASGPPAPPSALEE